MTIKNILWDFDGVILDSMPVRYKGFEMLFKNKFADEHVQQLLAYHEKNGGLSRYHKIRYFYEVILGQSINDDKVKVLAQEFSLLMKKELINKNLLINDAVDFIKVYYKKINMHIVSGSDGEELRFICKELGLSPYFLSIEGSPTPKKKIVENLLYQFAYNLQETVLIGDSINDFEAAIENDIQFIGNNNLKLKEHNYHYIDTFKEQNII